MPDILLHALGIACYYQSDISQPGECDLSFEEARLCDYFDTGRASLPKTGAPTQTGDAGSESTAKSTTYSPCTTGLATSRQVYGGNDHSTPLKVPLSDGASGDRSVTPSESRHLDNERETTSRFLRLEKTVEALSHGLILALTQLKSESGCRSGDVPRAELHGASGTSSSECDEEEETTPSDATTSLSRTLAGMGLAEKTGAEALASSQSDRKSPSHKEDDDGVCAVATGDDKLLFTSKNRSPISEMLGPILKFITSSDVYQFLKQVETHGGLRNTQLFDLSWVLNNLFNIHGGILVYCLRKSLTTMSDISQSLGSDVWSQDPVFIRILDEVYRMELHAHIQTDGSCNTGTCSAWKSYCLELSVIFSEHFPKWQSARYFRDLSESYAGCFNPLITSSYIEDLNILWANVQPALLEVTRWLEPFIDYGPDYSREIPFYDATIALGCRVRELFSRRDANLAEASLRADSLLEFLRENRSQALLKMQEEMGSVMSTVSRDFDTPSDTDKRPTESNPPSAEETALVERANQATGWQLTDRGPFWDALALHEVRVMKSYRPSLLLVQTAAATIRSGIFHVLSRTEGLGQGTRLSEKDVFWDGVV